MNSDDALAQVALLFFGPFLHEDPAIVAAGLLVVEHRTPAAFALASVYAGVVSSDFAIYGLGAAARRLPALRRAIHLCCFLEARRTSRPKNFDRTEIFDLHRFRARAEGVRGTDRRPRASPRRRTDDA